jgi:16S rRNA (guanine1207-N2)-methyltransferase
VLFLGAEAGFRLPDGFGGELLPVQGFRPQFLALAAAGYPVVARADGEDHDAALVLCGRHRRENEARIAAAVARTKAGGLILVAGGKEDGIASLRKRLEALTKIAGSMPKFHGAAFWFTRPPQAQAMVAALRESDEGALVEGRFRTTPGMFSHDRVDPGSRLLAENLPANLAGAVADFCAGWGFLAAEVAGRFPAVQTLDLYEADFASLEAARLNLAAFAQGRHLGFFWHDLAAEPVGRRYDAIVMNPPFHHGRAADPGIGKDMIRATSGALRKGGRLLMVANRQLPYEDLLGKVFARHTEIARDAGFKILLAER